jgi:hypothetical protein
MTKRLEICTGKTENRLYWIYCPKPFLDPNRHTQAHTDARRRTPTKAHTHTHTCTCKYIPSHVDDILHITWCMCLCVCVCMYTQIHTHIHTYIHLFSQATPHTDRGGSDRGRPCTRLPPSCISCCRPTQRHWSAPLARASSPLVRSLPRCAHPHRDLVPSPLGTDKGFTL